jgi:hypothetical protein
METFQTAANREQTVSVQNGWAMLILVLALVVVDIGMVVFQVVRGPGIAYFAASIVVISFLLPGFFSLQPNEARVLVLFGEYKGTVRTSGFHWGNPFYSNGRQNPAGEKLLPPQPARWGGTRFRCVRER